MPVAREYSGVILKCCRHQQTIVTTPEEEIALDVLGKTSKLVKCEACGSNRILEILRAGNRTRIGDRTDDAKGDRTF